MFCGWCRNLRGPPLRGGIGAPPLVEAPCCHLASAMPGNSLAVFQLL